MDIGDIEKGMWVGFAQGVGKVLAIDAQNNTVLLEERTSHYQFSAEISELIDELQIQAGCSKYG
ncbi:hypothetical protein GCM10007938_21130 [Vibrio zhanjiangensis]|uniref:Malate dehydrogenase n=1 Tax=Vibrio zhanjiangensis TaxID=1046128 RepID=A0ABQ6F0Q2_9VIBR|nr:hypothetical protein [Vibrio zhanjiangensis]GLT18335.1 hypothetical protein GCM10007938_21130 [Vibrio zhanjiangensis]